MHLNHLRYLLKVGISGPPQQILISEAWCDGGGEEVGVGLRMGMWVKICFLRALLVILLGDQSSSALRFSGVISGNLKVHIPQELH